MQWKLVVATSNELVHEARRVLTWPKLVDATSRDHVIGHLNLLSHSGFEKIAKSIYWAQSYYVI